MQSTRRQTLARSILAFQTVEWSHRVAQVHKNLSPHVTHYILPDLPDDVISPGDRQAFYSGMIPKQKRIQTIAACFHNPHTLTEYIEETQSKVDKFLVVGGNAKDNCSSKSQLLSTVQAIETAKEVTNVDLWAVANPNDKASVESVTSKIQAGVSTIVTQPLLSTGAYETFEAYPRDGHTSFIAGLALPKTAKSLVFWLQLLNQPELENDTMFRSHLDWFDSNGDSLVWAQNQVASLKEIANVDGIHYMPMRNTDDLLSLLGGEIKQ